MINKIYLFLALCLVTLSLRVNHQQSPNTLTSGWTPINIKNLTKDQKSMDEFIRESVKEYANGELVEGETQVEDGINYKYNYKVVDEVGRKTMEEVIAYEDSRGNKEVKSGHEINQITNG